MSSQRIPVLQLVDGFATEEHPGGAALFGIQLARHLDREHFAPFVCGLWRYGTASERCWRQQLESEGIGTAILVEQPRRLLPDLLRAAALLGLLIERVQPQVVNSHFERGDLLCLWSKLLLRSHPRIVRTMHADQQWQKRPWMGRLLNLVALPWLFDAEVAISRATQQVLDSRPAARLAGRRAVQLYNGISRSQVDRLSQARSVERLDPSRPPRITIVGRLEEQKGYGYFLQAGRELLRHVPEAELWIVGTGSLAEQLKAQAEELGISYALRWPQKRSDVEAILTQSDLMVSASIWEGFPTVLLEAMAAGLPIVATDIRGTREMVCHNETGLLVPPRDPAALAAGMLWMLNHRDEARRMARRAGQQIYRYTMEHTADGYNQLYRSILQS
jgi:glycosyltransferase involved in cell wall biosynthesis